MEETHSKKFHRVRKEEHYSLIQEPDSMYIGHVSPPSGSSENIASPIISYLNGRGLSLKNLVVIGCDGTGVNTGWKKGVIRRIEKSVGRPLQWAICRLHFNDLQSRQLFQHLDGNTSGPKSLS
ncbi:hypothetical protein AVEN_134364-1 [Araneus ventricosus]|uniref:DUF4371 domain-containing protein n=1 Tax=Araneus ventricosus TaxID=182803 RepID=A0A4Y2K5K3_ARAVE|nr:hypothetical protein AVEN_134364-1 [Araneus ventricosus]